MFRGRSHHTIDAKGRVSIPSEFREVLVSRYEETMVITNFDQCLVGYPVPEWQAFEARLNEMSKIQKDVRNFVRFFYSGAVECRLDKQGRVLLPPNLREFAGLERDVMIIGANSHVEFWNKDRWDAFLRQATDDFESMAGKISELGL